MGVPVSPRNIFPSNIQGLPTWYEVRVTEKGYLGRRGGVDMMVAMNPQTWAEDVKEIEPGGYLFYDSTKPMPSSMFREDINIVGVPLTAITNATYTDARQRQLFKNIIYVGALSVLLDIDERDQAAVRRAVQGQGEAARFQRQGAESRPRLGHAAYRPRRREAQGPPRRQCRRPHLRRRQQCRRPGRRLWRRHGVRLVSHHALLLAGRGLPGAIASGCGTTRRPARPSTPSSRPRTSSPRSAS